MIKKYYISVREFLADNMRITYYIAGVVDTLLIISIIIGIITLFY